MSKKSGKGSKSWKSFPNESENENEPVVSKENVKLYKQLQLLKNKNVIKYYQNVDKIERQANRLVKQQYDRQRQQSRRYLEGIKRSINEGPENIKRHIGTLLIGEHEMSKNKKKSQQIKNSLLKHRINNSIIHPQVNSIQHQKINRAAKTRIARLLHGKPELRRKISALEQLSKSNHVYNFFNDGRTHTGYHSTPELLKAAYRNNIQRLALSGYYNPNSNNEGNNYGYESNGSQAYNSFNNGSAAAARARLNSNNGSATTSRARLNLNNRSAAARSRLNLNNGSAAAARAHLNLNNGSAATSRTRLNSNNGSRPVGKLPPSEWTTYPRENNW